MFVLKFVKKSSIALFKRKRSGMSSALHQLEFLIKQLLKLPLFQENLDFSLFMSPSVEQLTHRNLRSISAIMGNVSTKGAWQKEWD